MKIEMEKLQSGNAFQLVISPDTVVDDFALSHWHTLWLEHKAFIIIRGIKYTLRIEPT